MKLHPASSIDLRVGSEFRVFENHKYSHIDPKADQDDLTTLVTATIDSPCFTSWNLFLVLLLKELCYQGCCKTEGNLGRIGLLIHSTAGFTIQACRLFNLELSNVANLPIKIYPENEIGQISLLLKFSIESEYGSAYGSKYQGQEGPTPSKSHSDF